MIKLRIDVDYPYPSRIKSFALTFLNRKIGKNYLKSSKIIAKMINETPKEIKAYWFFTRQTTPDKELLGLLLPDKHEVALHVVNDPYKELRQLEKATSRKIEYYTIHGTARLIARLIWRRKPWEKRAKIPVEFPLKTFHDYPTLCLDVIAHEKSISETVEVAGQSIEKGEIIEIHPEWLFQRGTFNHRGPYYESFKEILSLRKEFS